MLNAYNHEGSTKYVDFTTTKTTLFATRPDKCHLNYVVYDQDWEAGLAERLEGMDEVSSYVKNHNLGFEVPYEFAGDTLSYRPDYIARIDDGGPEPLNLVIEVKGQRDEKDKAKAETMRNLWVPAVNNARRFGRWGFLELKDAPYDAVTLIREARPSPVRERGRGSRVDLDRADGAAARWRPSRMSSPCRLRKTSTMFEDSARWQRACAERGLRRRRGDQRARSRLVDLSSISSRYDVAPGRRSAMARNMPTVRGRTTKARSQALRTALASTSFASPTTKSATISTTCCAESAR